MHVRGIAPRINFRKGERRNGALGKAREEAALLLVGAEELEWLRQTDGLVRRE